MITETQDTIAAVATPPGRAALGIVRISGDGCPEILTRVFQPRRPVSIPAFRPVLGRILLHQGKYVDEALLTYYRKPHSYTREDLAEISCHGNPLILEQVLDQVIASGARLARPGEFTYRAFLNGRIDLVQAEAVKDLITADSVYQAELALNQLDGRLSSKFRQLKTKFIELISLMEGNLDFSEEQHYNFIDQSEALQRLEDILNNVSSLIGSFERGRLIREGFSVALVGKPNVGKSSIFNALLGKDRAIVTAIPGTTRDYLEEPLTLGNSLIHILDTAGIRESQEEVEQIGIERSRQVIEKAELIVFILDGCRPLESEDFRLWQEIGAKDCLIFCNKSDMPGFILHSVSGLALPISAIRGTGLDIMIEKIQKHVENKIRYSSDDSVISSIRHRDILKQTKRALEKAREGVVARMSEEFPLIDLHEALRYVGEITGEVTIEDIYQQIFSTFCIGK